MRILYLSQYFPPEIGATQTRAFEMAKALIRAGHQVTVLTEVPNHPEGIIHPGYRGRLWARESVNGVDVLRVWVRAAPVKSMFARLAFYGSYMVHAILAALLLVRGRYDVLYATSPPLFVGGAACTLEILRRLPFVFEVRDLWPESAVALGEIRGRWAIRIAESLEALCYRRSRRIVAVTKGIYERLRQRGYGEEKLAFIPNGANVELYQPRTKEKAIVEKLGLNGKFVVIYTGLHGLIHGMEAIIQSAHLLRDHQDILFLLIGEGVRKRELVSLAATHQLENILFLPQLPESELARHLSCADVGLATTKRLALCEGTLPVKMFSYMACGLPVILAVRGEARRILDDADAGISVEPEDPRQLADAILRLKGDPALRETYGRNGRDYVVRHCDRRELGQRLEGILREVVDEFGC